MKSALRKPAIKLRLFSSFLVGFQGMLPLLIPELFHPSARTFKHLLVLAIISSAIGVLFRHTHRLTVSQEFLRVGRTAIPWGSVADVKRVRIFPLTPWWLIYYGSGAPTMIFEELIRHPEFERLGGEA